MKEEPNYFAPIVLIGERVRLEPLSRKHTDDLSVAGAQAEADCAGNARYTRKVGNRALRVEPRRWHFKLRQTNNQWVIDAVDAR